MIRTALNQNGEAIPVSRLNTDAGLRVAFDEMSSAATQALSAGVYLINPTANAFIRIAPTGAAGDTAGSFTLGAGAGGYFSLKAGDKIATRGIDGAGSLFVIPLENA